MTQKMILDVDTGIDDALALAYAIASPEIELLGVTVSYGNTPAANAWRNTQEVLRHLRSNVPVYRGADRPLGRTRVYSGKFHGNDGLGHTLGAVAEPAAASPDAADFIIAQAHELGAELAVVTTGPLTNLALAITKDPSIIDKIGRVVCMGGAFMAPGNVSKFAEANIYMDPEAADNVFRSNLPLTLVGLDVTRKTLLTRDDMLRWRAKGTEIGTFFADFTEFYLQAYKEHYPYLKGCALHDPLAVAVAKNPGFVQTVPMFIKVDLEPDALGRTTEDLHRKEPAVPNSQVCVQVEAGRFMNDFFGLLDTLMD
ncbi:nucleoside hydrolase [Paenibacillus hamazuiensis]|uniref:nucleoside hydrolase n=1 Tax=Paenibacillus hamazuiensis TaxID=2936508 RepID=UPI00200C568E|nr:nucleoside hydrolase [Paenibacillus hamazuiensis]